MPTKQQLEAIIALDRHKDQCREENDNRYAFKHVQKAFYALMGVICFGVIAKLIQIAFQNYER